MKADKLEKSTELATDIQNDVKAINKKLSC